MKLLSLILISVLTLNFSPKESKEIDSIKMFFHTELEIKDLVEIQKDLLDLDILLHYKSLTFNENKKLESISFHIDFQYGFSGSAATNNLNKKEEFGFYRVYVKGAASPFGVGIIN